MTATRVSSFSTLMMISRFILERLNQLSGLRLIMLFFLLMVMNGN